MDCMRDEFKKGTVLNDRFEMVAPLNQGSFGMVFLAKDLETDNQVAVKCITKSSMIEQSAMYNNESESCDELECHTRLGNHGNIVNLVTSFESKSHVFLVLEYCPMGDLYEAIRCDRGPLQTENVREFMLQLIDAVEYMHSKGLYHRDIKPENIFLTQNGHVKLGDFGLATTNAISHEACVGSDRYMAPEQYDPPSTGYSPAQADIWSVGICLLNVLFAKNPFVTPTQSDAVFSDFIRDRQSLFDVFPNLSQDAFDVLKAALCLDPEKRSLAEVRRAVLRAVSFTTDDDDIFDGFCTEDRSNVAGTTADREPLRTPSIQSPLVSQAESFPWKKALQSTPQKNGGRQLSAIPDDDDDEDLFAPSEDELGTSWFTAAHPGTSVDSDAASLEMGHQHLNFAAPAAVPKPNQLSESVPVRPKLVPTVSQIFGKCSDIYSKSWSDLWDEEEELESLTLRERQAQNARTYSQESCKGKNDSSNNNNGDVSSGSDSDDSSASSTSSSASSSCSASSPSAEVPPVLMDVPASVVNARAGTPHDGNNQATAASVAVASGTTTTTSTTTNTAATHRSAPIPTPRPRRNLENQSLPCHGLSKTQQAQQAQQQLRSPPKEPSMDQWAALGNRRRNCSRQARDVTGTPARPMVRLQKKQSMNDNWRHQGPPLPASWAGGYSLPASAVASDDKATQAALNELHPLFGGHAQHHYKERKQAHAHVNAYAAHGHKSELEQYWRHDPFATIKPRKTGRPAVDYWAGNHSSDEEFDFVGGWQDLHI